MRASAYRLFSRLTLAGLVVVCARTSAQPGGSLTIQLQNDTTDNLVVTVYDRTLPQHQMILSGQTLYGNASQALTIGANSSGQGHVYWTAMTTDPDMRQCGRKDKSGINDGETIHVSASNDCSS
jgi:hypothetical protein